jgi:hypothetical protein
MGVSTKYTIYGVEFDSTLLGGITHTDMPIGTEVRAEQTSGEVYPRMTTKVAENPRINLSTLNIAAALDLCGLTGLDISGLTTGLKLFGQKYDEASVPATGAVHRKFTVVEGLVVPRRLSVDHQGDARLDYEVLCTYDGSNDPIQVSDTTVTLPSGLTDSERFTLGKFTLGSNLMGDLRSLEIDFGIDARFEGGDSDVWPTFSWIASILPRVSLTSRNALLVKSDAIPIGGADFSHANTTFYLRKRTTDESSFLSDATEEHVKFTAAGYAHVENAFDGDSDNQGAQIRLEMVCKYDGTNAPLTVDTTSAIT